MKNSVWVLHAVQVQFGFNREIEAATSLVARLQFDFPVDTEVERVLEKAFEKSNSIDDHWFENLEVVSTFADRKVTRSTSVGDILMTYDRKFVVEAVGFREVVKKEFTWRD